MNTTANNPLVSVLLAVHNGERHIARAVQSILGQTFTDLELIIIDDCSTDNTAAILHSFADERIRVISNTTNLGLASSLNHGWKAARGRYIARMDADDISLPKRLRHQVDYLEQHPEVTICGTWVKTVGFSGGEVWQFPLEHEHIKAHFLFHNAISHPSVLIRRDDLDAEDMIYEDGRQRVEDYELWVRLSRKYKIHNIGKVLLLYRVYDTATLQKHRAVVSAGNLIRKALLEELGIEMNDDIMQLHEQMVFRTFNPTEECIEKTEAWLQLILEKNREKGIYDREYLEYETRRHWYRTCKFSTNLGLFALNTFWSSSLSQGAHLYRTHMLGFYLRCLLRMQPKKWIFAPRKLVRSAVYRICKALDLYYV